MTTTAIFTHDQFGAYETKHATRAEAEIAALAALRQEVFVCCDGDHEAFLRDCEDCARELREDGASGYGSLLVELTD